MFLILNRQNQTLIVTLNYNVQQVQTQEQLTNKVNIFETLITQGGGIIAFIFFWAFFLFLAYKKIKDSPDEQFELPTNSSLNHHCIQCRYYSKNKLLNCAVQPSTVLTEEAKNCLDYYPKNKK